MALKVLLPVDRSRNSAMAEEYALNHHKTNPIQVTLINVINEKILQDRGIGPDLMEKLLQSQREHAAKVLGDALEPFRKAGIESDIRIEYGLPGPTICRVAQEDGFGMVIITESALSTMGERLQGSVVSYVTEHSRVPVLLLKHKRP